MYDTKFKGSFKATSICVYKPRSIRRRTLGSISCKYYNLSSTPTDPSQLSAFGVTPGLRLVINSYRTSLAFFLSRVLVPCVTIQQIVAWPDLGRSGIEFLA